MPKTVLVVLTALLAGCGHAPQVATVPAAKPVVAAAKGPATPTGLPLDTGWKQQEYDYAVKNVKHPAWGLAHAERDLQIALELAAQEKLPVDRDVLFAAAYLHDLGGLEGFEKEGVDHGVRSAELAEPLLKGWGFPMAKFPLVKEVIVGHVYYGPAPTGAEARVFHDADLLDFLGPMGIVRLMAATAPSATMAGNLKTAKQFAVDLPKKLTTASARKQAEVRVAEMESFFKALDPYTYGGKAL
jgi:uncharacterized protein